MTTLPHTCAHCLHAVRGRYTGLRICSVNGRQYRADQRCEVRRDGARVWAGVETVTKGATP